MKQHMLTHKIREMPPTFDKSISNPINIATPNPPEEPREPSPERRASPEKLDLKRSPPIHVPPLAHTSPLDMPPLPKRPTGMCFYYDKKNLIKMLKVSQRYWISEPKRKFCLEISIMIN